MAYTKKTLASLKQSLADKQTSGKLPTKADTLSLWIRILNEGVAYCTDKLRLLKSTSLTTVSGTIALPDDFITINKVITSGGVELKQISRDQSIAVEGLYFWITGNHTDGFSLNTTSDETYTVFYSFRPEEMDADADVCIIPDPEAVVCYAYSRLRDSQSDPFEDSQKYMDECNNRLDQIIDQDQINDRQFGFYLQANA